MTTKYTNRVSTALLSVAATLMFLGSASAQASWWDTAVARVRAPTVTISPTPIVVYGTMFNQMIPMADAILAMPGNQVDILINSGGGSVIHGGIFINAVEMVKARGVRVRCFVTNLAASMAFQLLAHCDERYALRYSLLLWHPVRTGYDGPITPLLARSMATDLSRIEQSLVKELRTYLKLSDDVFFYHYHQETLFTGEQLAELVPGYITVVDDIGGLTAVTEIGEIDPFSFGEGDKDGVIWYERGVK